ncbi:MAG: helix-turn-helix transcriptional regulator [Ktedonobacteraceae bacterium]|nr:helix-turn-helix transcriptional regulator [Ktedonobacteraceae bacterium]
MIDKKGIPNTQLVRERLKRHWSQQELADHLGTTKVNVSRWERGVTFPGLYFRQKLCEVLEKPPVECNNRSIND